MRTKPFLLAALAALVVVSALALPVLAAQGAHPGPAQNAAADGPGPVARFLAKLALYLDLDDGQKAQAMQIFQDAHTQAEPIRQADQDLAQQLRDALGADSPDPAAVGALAISIHGNREQLRAIHDAAESDFRAILSDAQRTRLDDLHDARRIFRPHPLRGVGDGGDGAGELGDGGFGGL
jgi:Spy/CpxP family protein refolding chaperone